MNAKQTRQVHHFVPWSGIILASILFTGCFKKDTASSSPETGTVKIGITGSSAGSAGSSVQPLFDTLSLMDVSKRWKANTALTPPYSFSNFTSQSITSGPPDSLTLKVQKITLSNTSTAVTVFENTTGKDLPISGSKIDITQLFPAATCLDNNGAPYTLQTGESCDCGFYSDNTLVGTDSWTKTNPDGSTARVTGCPWQNPNHPANIKSRGPGGTFASLTASAGAFQWVNVTFARKATINGCVTGNFSSPVASTVSAGKHTYCTRTAQAMYKTSGGGTNSDFENVAPQDMDFDLEMAGPGWTSNTSDSVTLQFPIEGGLTIASGQSPTLTLVIDTNRLLRFYNMGRTDEGPNPGTPTDRSYFFNTVFNSSVFVFAGKPGAIVGYQWVTAPCVNVTNDASVPSDYICTTASSTVAGWLTAILDSSGVPLSFGFMPDDDNALTVIKGGNSAPDSSGHISFQSGSVTADGSAYDLKFGISGDSGTVMSVDPTQTAGTSVNIKMRGLQSSYGIVTLTRKL